MKFYKGEHRDHPEQLKGSNWLALHPQRFAAKLARQSVAGRQFAMMAAQGVDMMFTLCFGVLVFFNVVVYGTKSGAYLVYFRSIISRISFNSVEKAPGTLSLHAKVPVL